MKDYNAATEFNHKDNRRDAFEAEPPSKGLTWDDVAEARDVADTLMTEAQVGEAATNAKKEDGGFFGGLFGGDKKKEKEKFEKGSKYSKFYDEDEYTAKTSAPGKRTQPPDRDQLKSAGKKGGPSVGLQGRQDIFSLSGAALMVWSRKSRFFWHF